jgi:hypothetical protein
MSNNYHQTKDTSQTVNGPSPKTGGTHQRTASQISFTSAKPNLAVVAKGHKKDESNGSLIAKGH